MGDQTQVCCSHSFFCILVNHTQSYFRELLYLILELHRSPLKARCKASIQRVSTH